MSPSPVSVGATSCFPSLQQVLRAQGDSTVVKPPAISIMCCPAGVCAPRGALGGALVGWHLSLWRMGPGTGHLKRDGEVSGDGSEHRAAAKRLIYL